MRIKLVTQEQGTTLGEAIDTFLSKRKTKGIVPATLRSYKLCLEDFSKFCDNKDVFYLQDITEDVTDAYKNFLGERLAIASGKQLTAEAKNTYLRIVRAFLNFFKREKVLPEIAITLFATPKKESISTYSDEELKKVFDKKFMKTTSFSDLRDYAMAVFLLSTGVRRATLREVRVSDINFNDNEIVVRHIKRNQAFITTRLPLLDDLKEVLKKYIKASDLGQHSEYLFPNASGKMLSPDSINKRLNLHFEKAGVQFRGCHEFRRTFGSKMDKQLKNDKNLLRFMGLSDPRMLEKYVDHPFDELVSASTGISLYRDLFDERPLRKKKVN